MPSPRSRPGKFAWRELMTPDRVASERYYTRLFGWTTREVDMAEGPLSVSADPQGATLALYKALGA